MMMQITDYVGPETTAELIAAFGTDILRPSVPERDTMDINNDGMVTGYHIWHRLWLFGLIEDEDVVKQRSCGDLWRPDGRVANGYYIPDDDDTEISIDNPPQGVYDARPI